MHASSEPDAPTAAPAAGGLLPVLAAWLVPGAGHALLRRPWPALFVALAVLPTFVLGMALTGWESVSLARHPYYFALQAPAGLVAFAGELLTRGTLPDRLMPHASIGTLYGAVAGLLNLIAVADVWARSRRGDPAEREAPAHDGAAGGDGNGQTSTPGAGGA